MSKEALLTEVQKKILLEINTLPDEVVSNLLEIIKIIKQTINYPFGREEKPLILGQFQSLKDDWEAPGMEKYDEL